MANQSRSVFDFVVFSFFFSVSGKVLPISPLLSGVFVYRVFCAYFVSFEGTGVMCRFSLVNTGEHLIIKPAMALKVIVTRRAF